MTIFKGMIDEHSDNFQTRICTVHQLAAHWYSRCLTTEQLLVQILA